MLLGADDDADDDDNAGDDDGARCAGSGGGGGAAAASSLDDCTQPLRPTDILTNDVRVSCETRKKGGRKELNKRKKTPPTVTANSWSYDLAVDARPCWRRKCVLSPSYITKALRTAVFRRYTASSLGVSLLDLSSSYTILHGYGTTTKESSIIIYECSSIRNGTAAVPG